MEICVVPKTFPHISNFDIVVRRILEEIHFQLRIVVQGA